MRLRSRFLVTLALGAWPGRLPDDSGQSRTTPGGVRPFPTFPVALVQAPLCAYAHASLSRLAPSATGPQPVDCATTLRAACVGRRPAAFRSAPRLVPCSRALRASQLSGVSNTSGAKSSRATSRCVLPVFLASSKTSRVFLRMTRSVSSTMSWGTGPTMPKTRAS